jgi:nicotinamidase-related amidase
MGPEGVLWPVFGDSIRENNTAAHIGELLSAAKLAAITVAVSPHYFYPIDKQ